MSPYEIFQDVFNNLFTFLEVSFTSRHFSTRNLNFPFASNSRKRAETPRRASCTINFPRNIQKQRENARNTVGHSIKSDILYHRCDAGVARKGDDGNRKCTIRLSVSLPLSLSPPATISEPSKHIHNARRNAHVVRNRREKNQIRPYIRIYARTRECDDTAITVSLVLLLLGVAPTDIVAIYTTTFAFSTCPTWGDPRCICWICTRSKIVFRVQFTLSCKTEDYRADYY